MDKVLDALCAFATEMRTHTLTASQCTALKLRTLDAIGCGIAASTAAPVEAACATVKRMDGASGPCQVLGHGQAAVDRAAFLNGFMVRYLDYNDSYFGVGGCHPSDLIPVAIAIGEDLGLSGHDVLRAVAIGYHVYCALNDIENLPRRGFDHVNFGGIAAAVTAATLLDLSGDAMRNAISLAVVPQAALRQTRYGTISQWKGAAFANAAAHAVAAAFLAAGGMTGPDQPFDGKYGFVSQVSGPLPLALDPSRDRTNDTYIKLFPLGHHAQCPVELAIDLRARLGSFAPGDAQAVLRTVQGIEVRTYRDALSIMADSPDKWTPKTHETADHSLPFVVALALGYGHIQGDDIDRGLHDPAVLALTALVKANEDESAQSTYPRLMPVTIKLQTAGGPVEGSLAAALGHTSRPVPPERISAKFHANADASLGAERAAALERRLLAFETLASIKGVLAG